MDRKKRIIKVLSEAEQKKVVMTSDKYEEMKGDLDDDTIVKIVDEEAIIEADMGGDMGADTSTTTSTSDINIPKLQSDVQRFMDKLNLNQFKDIIAKIDKPIEKAELISAFAERIGVPRNKLGSIMSSLKQIDTTQVNNQQQESIRPRMKKSALIEHILKGKR